MSEKDKQRIIQILSEYAKEIDDKLEPLSIDDLYKVIFYFGTYLYTRV